MVNCATVPCDTLAAATPLKRLNRVRGCSTPSPGADAPLLLMPGPVIAPDALGLVFTPGTALGETRA